MTIYIVHHGHLDTSSAADIFRQMDAAYRDSESAHIDANASDASVTEFCAYTVGNRAYADAECTQEIQTFD